MDVFRCVLTGELPKAIHQPLTITFATQQSRSGSDSANRCACSIVSQVITLSAPEANAFTMTDVARRTSIATARSQSFNCAMGVLLGSHSLGRVPLWLTAGSNRVVIEVKVNPTVKDLENPSPRKN